jgi:anhydro-N-acetylmuramic acid kinase
MLLDAWAARHLGSPRDDGGHWAASGTVNEKLLATCLADPWFGQPPPKSTGRDHFHLQWLDRQGVSGIAPQNVQATLSELTAASIATAITQWCPGVSEVYACGGGVHNRDLMNRLALRLGQIGQFKVATTDALGVPADWVEAVAFAWLARQTLNELPGNLPTVTGASGYRVLGSLYPR